MKTIWKFPLAGNAEQYISMPAGAEVIAVQEQFGAVQAWAIVDPAKPLRVVQIIIRGTGQPLGEVGKYVGTFQMEGGGFVFHAFVSYPETRPA